MRLKYICPFWGCEKDSADVFVEKVIAEGYDGIEISLPPHTNTFTESFFAVLEDIHDKNSDFVFIVQQLSAPDNESVDSYISKMKNRLLELASYQPIFINSHTGKDYYSFDDNCRVIEAALNCISQTGVRILHETHRGRFPFHASSLLLILKNFQSWNWWVIFHISVQFQKVCCKIRKKLYNKSFLMYRTYMQG